MSVHCCNPTPSLLASDALGSSARMMFCTTFLSAPSEEQNCDGGGRGGGLRGADLGPGSCLSSLHCLVLPQDELNPVHSDSDSDARLSVCPKDGAQKLVSRALLGVGGASLAARRDECIWDRVRRRRSRSASPSPSKTPKSPCNQSVKGREVAWPRGDFFVSAPSPALKTWYSHAKLTSFGDVLFNCASWGLAEFNGFTQVPCSVVV